MKKIKILILIIGIVFQANRLAQAQILLEQGKIKLSLQPGTNIVDSLTIHNNSNQEARGHIYWEDFLYLPPFDGKKKFLPSGTTPLACGSWINFSPKEFVLPPFGKKIISYTINVPKDASGGYYGVLFFEKDAGEVSGKMGLNVVTRVGSLFFLETKDRSKMAVLENVTMTPHTVRGSFTNKGNVILIPEGVFYVMDEQGLVVDRGEAGKIYLPPGETAEYSMNFSPELPAGRYMMVMTMDLEDGDVMVKEIDFEKVSSAELRVITTRD